MRERGKRQHFMCELKSLEMGLCHPYTHPLFPLRSKNLNLSQTYKTGSEEMLYAETRPSDKIEGDIFKCRPTPFKGLCN